MKLKLWLFFIIIASSTAVIGLVNNYHMNIIERDLEHLQNYYMPLIEYTHEIKNNSTQAHVLVEEILAGDTAEQIDQVWSLLDKSEQYARNLRNENLVQLKKLHPEQQQRISKQVDLLLDRIIEFRKSAQQRFDYEFSSGVAGSGIDEEYDELYETVQRQLNVLIGSHMQAQYLETVRNAGLAKYHLANGHLFLEELLSGDHINSIDEILGDFERAKYLITSVVNSDASGGMARNLDAIISISQQRYNNEEAFNQKRAQLDVSFDASFDQFYHDINATQQAIGEVTGKEFSRLSQTRSQAQNVTMLLVVLVFLLAAFFARLTVKNFSAKSLPD